MGKVKAYRQLGIQAIATVICALFALCMGGIQAGYSAFLGGMVVIVPSFLFIVCVFHYSGARMAGKMLGSFFLGEVAKLVSMAILTILILKFIPLKPFIFLLSFLMIQFTAAILGFLWSGKTMVRT